MAVEGLRAELAVIRTARAAAAWQGRTAVNEENLKEAWELCLGHRQTEQQPNQMPTTRPPDSPRSKTNEANGGNALSPSTPGSSMAMTPREADPRPHPLKPVVVRNALEMLREELMHKPNAAAQTESKRDRLSTQRTGTADSIAWLASICRSWTHGWRPGNERFEVMYHHPQRRPSLWVFLDASRSTGARQFLSRAREEIKGLARQLKSWRFEIVLLHGDGIRWIARRAGRMGAIQALDALPDARGKSLLEEGVGAVTRARLRRGANANDGIIVCSDGYVSPAVNETGGRARRRLRRALERLRQTKASVFAWLYPEPVRGMSEWIPKLCSGFKAHLISIKLS
jgi:hypothetical protein